MQLLAEPEPQTIYACALPKFYQLSTGVLHNNDAGHPLGDRQNSANIKGSMGDWTLVVQRLPLSIGHLAGDAYSTK